MYPYNPAFGFPFDNWFDDVWFTKMQQEFQIMLVTSWADMTSRLVLAVGLIQCMESIKDMFEPIKSVPRINVSTTKVAAITTTVTKSHRQPNIAKAEEVRNTVVGSTNLRDEADADTERKNVRATHRFNGRKVQVGCLGSLWTNRRRRNLTHFLLEKAGPRFFVSLGFVILVVHIVAETRETAVDIPCLLKLHPWFVNKPSCSLVELDCHQLGDISGSQDSMRAAWNTFEFSATTRIFVRHCPQLELPSTIHKFHLLTSLKLYNCSIASWSEEAAFVTAVHQKMRAIFAVRTKFPNGELPVGLLTTQYPKGLKSFVTSATNIRTLPDSLHEVWPQAMTLAFEYS